MILIINNVQHKCWKNMLSGISLNLLISFFFHLLKRVIALSYRACLCQIISCGGCLILCMQVAYILKKVSALCDLTFQKLERAFSF